MGINNIHIVGEKFIEFAKHKNNVFTIFELDKLIDKLCIINNQQKFVYILGQGIRSDTLDLLKFKIKKRNLDRFIQFKNEQLLYQREDKNIVHKQRIENVMITKPIFWGGASDTYKSSLILDDRCAEMSDHITGQHLQGMVLTEAARQMMLAVGERYLLGKDEKCNGYFTLNKLSPEFKGFAFPLEIDIYYCGKQTNRVSKNCLNSSALVSFTQGQKIICEVEICFSIFNKSFLNRIERREALKVVNLVFCDAK